MPQRLASLGTGVFSVLHHSDAINEDVGNTDSIMVRVIESGWIADFGRIEDNDIGPISFAQFAAAFEMKCICGQACHFADCIFEFQNV
jgi:hypothetical protein